MGKLPELCYSTLASTGESIIIKRGEKGYYKMEYQVDADEMNKKLGVTKEQEQAMKVGSMFGFDVPGADPEVYKNDIMEDIISIDDEIAGGNKYGVKYRVEPKEGEPNE